MAQSLKSPVGVPLFWESGANPPQEWPSWLSTIKMAVMAKENLIVDQLLRLKLTNTDLFYPTVPSYEDTIEGANDKETRKRQIRNERRRVDWENECRAIRNRGPMIDRYTWDDADIKVKSLVYLSLGTEASRIYHQRNPHTLIDRCSTNELIYELGITFIRPRNITFDRFQLITVQQNSNEKLETFYSRLRELGSKAALGNVEEDLIKDFFFVKMNNSTIQMELLSEVRTPAQVLNFALSRERGQENQREILRANPFNWNQVNATTQQTNRNQSRPQTNTRRQQKQMQDIQPCWRCGAPFTQGHNINCPAKGAQCNICKKLGHFAKLCRSKMPERPRQRPPQRSIQQQYNQSPGTNQTRRVRHVTEKSEDTAQEILEDSNETVDPEATLYLKELTEDWVNINLVQPSLYKAVKNIIVNKTNNDEIWKQHATMQKK